MGSVYRREDSPFWWVQFKDINGKFHPISSKSTDEKVARKLLRELERQVQAQLEKGVTAASGPLTVERYALGHWIPERERRGVFSVKDDAGRLRHALPALGHILLTEVRPRDIRDVIRDLMSAAPETRLAPRTIRHVYGVLRVMFNDAVADELIDASPCVLRQRRKELPKKVDKDPRWRRTAVYDRHELERLLWDGRIPLVRRVLYGTLFLTGMRISEVAARRWRDYDPEMEPLGRLSVYSAYVLKLRREKGLKTETPREVPVHPTLARLLAEWRLSGWREWTGRDPQPDDLILPGRLEPHGKLSSVVSAEIRRRAAAGIPLRRIARELKVGRHTVDRHLAPPPADPAAPEYLSSTVSLDWLKADCDLLGFRRRRQHDSRRTFISLGRADGARKEILTWISHGAEGDQVDDYTTFPWPELCAEVSRIRIRMLEGKVLPLLAAVSGAAPSRSSNST